MKELSKRYNDELDGAAEEIETDKNLDTVSKMILTSIIHSEKTAVYGRGEFEENCKIFDSIGSCLDSELLKIARKKYRFSFWFYKKAIKNNVCMVSNGVLANWFEYMDIKENILSTQENDNTIEQLYLLNDIFNPQALLEEKERFNTVRSLWLDHSDISAAVESFFQSIKEKKYLKVSVESEIYDNDKWYKKVTLRKNKWRDFL